MTVHVLYENPDWLPPLTDALDARGLPWRAHDVQGGVLDLSAVPEPGVYINRMSPSAHTRGHQGGVTFIREYLALLEAHGRPVINGQHAFALEVSKVRQDIALRRAGIRTPATIAVVAGDLREAARRLGPPFVTKHNQGGKGLGVRLFRDLASFDAYLDSPDFIDSPDGITLLQRYVEPAQPHITRVEIVDGRFLYAIRSSTAGGFELCPADTCALDDDAMCPIDGGDSTFSLRTDLGDDDPLVRAYTDFLAANHIDLAGIEFVEDADGVRWTYDVNGTTNYNGTVEAAHGLHGMGALADLAAARLDLAIAAK